MVRVSKRNGEEKQQQRRFCAVENTVDRCNGPRREQGASGRAQ